ncbi:ABC transporter ATP-binding protein [Arthrobacter sp. zg-Y820]|uniref:ABC transporter ATP-binding protein n=1 Tax=unclassified Arthrobacter TaxID=235627 RepID=UPI001E5564DC|nr:MULTISPECIES: ABC transporter ATP-binding protein [unclassified Arthrobacter]MCC9196455.1 ABC transporter ATP-binding protein [Arthrobacter sp. zg-Y820]MDK1279317.1 ABC transporter ATP-binding protein [Arthrobacter sp. zg.Y820]MDK1359063.1 ABC transporter ATP-binding protein [Arthrobacter sp. zg-Y1219]WIB08292.1 ABC transporter ATP-binding protein [Arthrobacter sp. zg-Y820]
MASSPAIRTENLLVRRSGTAVLNGLSLTVPAGQVVGLLGPSGSGKTTLMRTVVGTQKTSGGTVTVLGNPAGSPQLRRKVGYLAQGPGVYDDLTVAENLRYFARIVGAPDTDPERVIGETGLEQQSRRLAGSLSGGQHSRVSLAVALLGAPELLVLDEPTVGLDPVLRRDLWKLFASLAERGVSLLVSSHVMDEASRCARILLLHEGRLLADMTPPELLESTGTTDADAAFLALLGAA